MANSLVKCLEKMKEKALQTTSGMKKICQPFGDAGTRCFPPPNHDPKIGGRLDLGAEIEGGKKRRLNFQVNKNAENNTLNEMAGKDSHKVVASVDVDVSQPVTKENTEKIFEELKRDVKR